MKQEQQLTRVWRVAKELDVTKKRVYQMVKEGKLEAVNLGPRSMRITRSSICAFIETYRKRPDLELGGTRQKYERRDGEKRRNITHRERRLQP